MTTKKNQFLTKLIHSQCIKERIAVLVLFILFVYSIYLLGEALGSIKYIPSLFDSEPSAVCRYKQILWGREEYPLTVRDNKSYKYVLKVINRHENSWGFNFQAIGPYDMVGEFYVNEEKFYDKDLQKKRARRFTHCVASGFALKDPTNRPKDLVEESPGVDVQLGYYNNSDYYKISDLNLSVAIEAYRYTDEDYNFNAVMKYIAENYIVKTESDGSIGITFVGEHTSPKAFNYEFTKVNNDPLNSLFVDFISKDGGNTWTPIPINK